MFLNFKIILNTDKKDIDISNDNNVSKPSLDTVISPQQPQEPLTKQQHQPQQLQSQSQLKLQLQLKEQLEQQLQQQEHQLQQQEQQLQQQIQHIQQIKQKLHQIDNSTYSEPESEPESKGKGKQKQKEEKQQSLDLEQNSSFPSLGHNTKPLNNTISRPPPPRPSNNTFNDSNHEYLYQQPTISIEFDEPPPNYDEIMNETHYN